MMRSSRLFALYMNPTARSPISSSMTTMEWFLEYKWHPNEAAFVPLILPGDQELPDIAPGDFVAFILGDSVFGPVEVLDIQRTLSSGSLEIHFQACGEGDNLPRKNFPKTGEGLVLIEKLSPKPIVEEVKEDPEREPTVDEYAALDILTRYPDTLRLMPVLYRGEQRMAIISMHEKNGEQVAMLLALLLRTTEDVRFSNGEPMQDAVEPIVLGNLNVVPTLLN